MVQALEEPRAYPTPDVPTTYPIPPIPAPILRYFAYDHLRPPLARVSSWFHTLAHDLERDLPSGPEKSVALRKLLEAKDAAVRAALDLPPGADIGLTADDTHAAAQRVIAEDAVRNPGGHPCRDCGQLYRDHPTRQCEAWR